MLKEKIHNKILLFILSFTVLCSGCVLPAHAEEEASNRIEDFAIFKSDESYAYIRGNKIPYEGGGAVKISGKNYIPIRFAAQMQNSDIKWNSENKTATVYFMEYELEFTADKNIATKFEPCENIYNQITMDASALLYGDKLYVPAKGAADAFGFSYKETESGISVYSTIFETTVFPQDSEIEAVFDKEYKSDNVQYVIYVDEKNGRDSWNGTVEQPVRTINTAKEIIRKFKHKNVQNGNIEVYLRDGHYFLDKTIEFTEADSGENGYDIIYKAYPGENVVINGGKPIKGWKKYNDNIYYAYVGKDINVNLLFENGVFGKKARYPNEGYNTVTAPDSGPVNGIFCFRENEIPEISDTNNLQVSIWPGGAVGNRNWFQDIIDVKGINYSSKTVTLNTNARYELGTGSRYFLQGVFELLDSPGEFYFDDNGYVYYYPLGEDITKSEIVVPVAGDIIDFKGDGADKPVHNIKFQEVEFCNTDYGKYGVFLENASWIEFDSCHFYNIGKTAVYAYGKCQNITVKNSLIENIGQNGIELRGEMLRKDTINKYNTVRNNKLQNLGLIVGHTYPIYGSNSGYNYIGHNQVSNSPRFGIALDGDKPSIVGKTVNGEKITVDNANDYVHSRYNIIEYNDIYKTMTDSQDGGAIYTWSPSVGNIIRGNAIHNNTVGMSIFFPLYLDDGSDETVVYDNIIYNNQEEKTNGKIRGTVCLKGVDIKFYNNILANNQQYEGAEQNFISIYSLPMSITRNENVVSTGNISYNSGEYIINIPKASFDKSYPAAAALTSPVETRFKKSDENMFYNNSGKYLPMVDAPEVVSLDDWLKWQNGKYDTYTLFNENPSFIDEENNDFRLMYNSKAYSLGFEDIDIKDIGLEKEFPFSQTGDALQKIDIFEKETMKNSFVDISVGGKAELCAEGRTENGYKLSDDDIEVKFISDNPEVATVSENGTAYAQKEGTAKITATAEYNGVIKSVDFYVVVDDKLSEFEIKTDKNILLKGDTSKLKISTKTNMGKSTAEYDVVYSSSDENVAIVNEEGVVTGVGVGNATIYATATSGGQSYNSSCNVIVKDKIFKSFDYSVNKDLISVNEKANIKIIPLDQNRESYDIDSADISVESSDTSVAQIEYVSKGSYNISGNKTGIAEITVNVTADELKLEKKFKLGVADTSETGAAEWSVVDFEDSKGSFKMYNSGFYTLESNGANIWGKKDQATFGYKKIKLDPSNPKVEIRAELSAWPGGSLEDGSENQSHMGLMIRNSLDSDSQNVALRFWQTGAVRFTYRKDKGGESSYQTADDLKEGVMLRLVLEGSKIKGYIRGSADEDWISAGETTLPLGEELYVGLCGYSGNTASDGTPVTTGMFGKAEVRVGDEVVEEEGSFDRVFNISESLKEFEPLKNKEKINVVYLGGSITQGAAATSNANSYVGIVSSFLEKAFPNSTVNNINSGFGGTSSDYGLLRLYDDCIVEEPDVVFVEFAVNARTTPPDTEKRQMEGIVRNLLELPKKPIIVFLYTPTTRFDACDNVHQEVADYYGIPSINIQEYIRQKAALTEINIEDIFSDDVHPNNKGHEEYATYIMECLNNPEKYLKAAIMPEKPMTDYYSNMGKIVGVSEAKLTGNWEANGDGLITQEKNATLTFKFTGPVLAIKNRIGTDFGEMEISVDGKVLKTIDNYYTTTNQSVMWYNNFELPDKEHTLVIKVTGKKNDKSSGTKVGIDGIIVKR